MFLNSYERLILSTTVDTSVGNQDFIGWETQVDVNVYGNF